MTEQIPPTLRVIGVRPENVPVDWAIHKAIRPLDGDMLWKEDGFFFAAIAPYAGPTRHFNRENFLSKAIRQEYVDLETAIAEQIKWYQDHTPKVLEYIDFTDADVRAQMVIAWRNRQWIEHERTVAEFT